PEVDRPRPLARGRTRCPPETAGYDFSSARAGVAHLVERDLAKVEVAGSKPVSRSSTNLSKKGIQAPRGTATTRSVPSGKASASRCSKIPATSRDRWPESAA